MAIPALRLQKRQQDPDLVFLSETKLLSQEFDKVKRKIAYLNGIRVDAMVEEEDLDCYGNRTWK